MYAHCRKLLEPVLIFDHRGIGLSTYSTPEKNDKITLELMARDLLALLTYLGWKEVDIIGFSMGGVVAQQLLLLPFHAEDPTPLPFRVHHVLLTGTLCSPIKNPSQPPIVKFEAGVHGQGLSVEQRKAMARPMLDASLGARWVAKPENKERQSAFKDGSKGTATVVNICVGISIIAHLQAGRRHFIIHKRLDHTYPHIDCKVFVPNMAKCIAGDLASSRANCHHTGVWAGSKDLFAVRERDDFVVNAMENKYFDRMVN
ncbi:hypothetical protein BU17DRAFT_67076 [Hysterangium stoloniferum]|nr:hypothetical protein BU17DRAFT_67076 [Hysterangium stoloniferum]